ncbi:zinc finger C2H2-type/integrase DNA-binding domain-containing protein [Tanacetum coccineum]
MWRKKLNLQGDVINISNSAVSHVHQCKICDKVFPTGQALGGHKRCHWTGYSEAAQAHVQAQAQAISSQITSTGEAASTQTESGRIVLDIDLNEVPAIMMEDEGGDANANVNGNGYASSSYNSNMGY